MHARPSSAPGKSRRAARTDGGTSAPGTEDVVGNRIGSSFLFRFVTQQNQFLLSEGVSLPEETKKRLGADFDHLLSRLGECALLHGVSYGYWNADHLEIIEMARAAGSGFFPLLDEMTGELMLGVQFWQLGTKRPMFLRLFEQDGVTILRVSGKQVDVVPGENRRMCARSAATHSAIPSTWNVKVTGACRSSPSTRIRRAKAN